MKLDSEKIKKLRGDDTIKSLSKIAGISERRWQQIEAGKLVNVGLNNAKAIAAAIGVKLDKIAKV